MTYNTRSIKSERFLVFCLYVGGLNGLRVYHGMHNNKTKDYENSGFSCPLNSEMPVFPIYYVCCMLTTLLHTGALILIIINYITYNILLVCSRSQERLIDNNLEIIVVQAVHGNRPEARVQSAFKYAALIISTGRNWLFQA